MKENNLFERLFLVQTKYLFELNNICLNKTKYLWAKEIFVFNQINFSSKQRKILLKMRIFSPFVFEVHKYFII